MKSSIKVDYKSRFGDGFPEKEPVIKITLESSDDPRDTLLSEIFEGDPFCKRVGISNLTSPDKNGVRSCTIYKRSDREYKINDIISPIFMALCKYSGIEATFVTSSDEMYFELADNHKVRSAGFDHPCHYKTPYDPFNEINDREVELRLIQAVVDDWKNFEKIVEESKNPLKWDKPEEAITNV